MLCSLARGNISLGSGDRSATDQGVVSVIRRAFRAWPLAQPSPSGPPGRLCAQGMARPWALGHLPQRRAQQSLPAGGKPGRKDPKPRKRSGHVAGWEEGGKRRAAAAGDQAQP